MECVMNGGKKKSQFNQSHSATTLVQDHAPEW
jgi:hypothetical protein